MMEIDLHLLKRKYGYINEANIEGTSMVIEKAHQK